MGDSIIIIGATRVVIMIEGTRIEERGIIVPSQEIVGNR
jgi:hypothetical protein